MQKEVIKCQTFYYVKGLEVAFYENEKSGCMPNTLAINSSVLDKNHDTPTTVQGLLQSVKPCYAEDISRIVKEHTNAKLTVYINI